MLFLLLLLSLAFSVPPLYGRLQVINNKLCDASGNPIILRGVGFAWHNWWPEFYTSAKVGEIKTVFHANVVRAAIAYDKEGGLQSNPTRAYDLLYAVIDGAIAQGIYVIVDWQVFQIFESAAVDFFTKVATKYKGVPNILYEILNEPESDGWPAIKRYALTVIKVIRAIDPENPVIIVGTPSWDQYIEQAAADPITEYKNILYSLHIYVGTHPDSYRTNARNSLSKIGIFATEMGAMNADGDGPLNREKFNQWISFYEEVGISYLAWALQTGSISCGLTNSVTISDLTEWGKLFRDTIYNKQ
uniref:Putative glycosyl hydrolase family5 n=1 Tax=uncultured symbiotic protist of Cryptocercus punctulatus TaxID=403662 RepID=A4UX46_9EUKA|nr:putative glycosyl hydrolase family5 [uncultured symbiotic protist of Cryptocercus punctulatus]